MRMLLNVFLFFLVIVSCDSKQKNIEALTIKDSVVLEKSVANNQAPICLDHLIEIIQSNSKCQELIGYMNNQNVKYGFQIDSFPVLSRTSPQDSLMH